MKNHVKKLQVILMMVLSICYNNLKDNLKKKMVIKYIINVIDDESPYNVLLYSKSVSIDKSVNIINRLSEINRTIKNNNYIIKKFDLFNKLEVIKKK